jgi:hypothetical protein
MGRSKKKPSRSASREKPLTWQEHMFIRPEDKRVIQSWSDHYGWSSTVAKRNFTVYRALEWLAAVLEDQLEETGGWFWCQQERICSTLGMSRPTVRAAIEHLAEIGVVEHERRWLPQAESLCSWFRLKIPPSCAGRVRKDNHQLMLQGLRKPPVGTAKNSTRRVQNFYAPSSSYKREKLKRERANVMAEIQERCIARALDPQSHAPEIHEIVEAVAVATQRCERAARRALRDAGEAEFLDVRLAAAKGG